MFRKCLGSVQKKKELGVSSSPLPSPPLLSSQEWGDQGPVSLKGVASGADAKASVAGAFLVIRPILGPVATKDG